MSAVEAAAQEIEIRRSGSGLGARWERFTVKVRPGDKVLDLLDAIWARRDHSLLFRRACHHSSCGACAMRINGRERLACITAVETAAREHAPIRVEPLRNLPVVGDLVSDVSPFFERMSASELVITRTAEPRLPLSVDHLSVPERPVDRPADEPELNRFETCIECAACISACPSMAAGDGFLGPAALAGIHRALKTTSDQEERSRLLALADGEDGVWRCHSSFECSAVCPQSVDPAGRIMSLRRQLLGHRWRRLWRA